MFISLFCVCLFYGLVPELNVLMMMMMMSSVSPVHSPKRQSRWVLADYGGKKSCGKGEILAWNETVSV